MFLTIVYHPKKASYLPEYLLDTGRLDIYLVKESSAK